MYDQDPVLQAVELAKTGKKDEARTLIRQALDRDRGDARAWAVAAQLAGSPKKAIFAVKQVLRLKPDNAWARQYLAELEREQDSDMPLWLIFALASLATVLFVLVMVFVGPLRQDRPSASNASLHEVADLSMSDCRSLTEQALLVSDEKCQSIGQNQICYGHNTIEADIAPEFSDQFALVGDVAPIESVRTVSASPLNLVAAEWGIAVFKLQATLPHTVPGQNVTFLLFGDTSLENASGDMHAVYFSTGFGSVTCEQVPFDGIMIRMPDGAGITLQANDTGLTLMGSTLLEAQPGGEMIISMLDGQGIISAGGQDQAITGGNAVRVPLGGEDGLRATGPPSGPEALPNESVGLGCILFGLNCPPPLEAAEQPPGGSGQPTNTPVPVPPGQPTNTSVPLATNTPAPAAPGQPTNTPVPAPPGQPTNTPKPPPTNTPKPPPTNTPVPPPTNTPVPPPTDTPEPPPTDTPVTASCSDISLSWAGSAQLSITNNYSSDIVLTHVSVSWPEGDNGVLKKITLAAPAIWNQPSGVSSPASITLGEATDKRTIALGATKTLAFEFANSPVGSGYSVTLTFDVGCSRGASN